MKFKDIIIAKIVAIALIFAIASLSSCSTTEQCWAYSSCHKVKSAQSKHNVGYARNHKQPRGRGNSYGCYSFNGY